MKRIIFGFGLCTVVLVFLCVFSLLPANAGTLNPNKMVVVSGSPGGTYYFIGVGAGKIINDKLQGVEANVESSTSSGLENLNYIERQANTIGLATMDTTLKGIAGDKATGYKFPLKKLRILIGGHVQSLYLVALANSPIKTFADFKGAKVGTLTKGATIRAQLDAIMEELNYVSGKDWQPVPLTYMEQADALRDGNLQVMTTGGGVPQAAVMDIASDRDIRLIDFDDKLKAIMLKKHPYWTFGTIPAGTYRGVDKDTTVIKAQTIIVCNSDLSDEFAYKLAKALFDNNDIMASVHPEGKNWALQNSLDLYKERPDLPWHPGVKKLLDEMAAKK